MENNILAAVKEVPGLLTTIYGDLAQPSVKAIGSTIGTLLEFSTLWHLKLKLKNEKEKAQFKHHLDQYNAKLENVPEEELIEVNPQIGVPILERLSYTTNEELADLFTTLLKKASSSSTVNEAHPRFINAIEGLTVDEARIIKHLYGKVRIASVTFRVKTTDADGGFTDVVKNATMLKFVNLDFPQDIGLYIANLISLGILEHHTDLMLPETALYNQLVEKYDYNSYVQNLQHESNFASIDIKRGIYEITDYGQRFISAVIHS